MTMGITLVARGRDHMINTPPQIMLYEAFGAKLPEFAHLPMMLAPNGEKLSKRHGAVERRASTARQGYAPNAVLNYLARFGWSHGDQEIFSKDELVAGLLLGVVRARRRQVRREEVPRHQPRAPEDRAARLDGRVREAHGARSSRSAASRASAPTT